MFDEEDPKNLSGEDMKQVEDEHHYHGVTLVPAPSDNPLDPLNWPRRKKLTVLGVLGIAVFAGVSAPLTGQLNVKSQAALYHQSTTHIAWQNSAASAGFASGGFFFAPISLKLGRSSTIFWTLIACLLTQVWAALMIHRNQFNSFVLSRFFSGFFGGIVNVLGPRILLDIFFLHQRGRAFTAFHWGDSLGSAGIPTLSAFITANRSWTLEFWWTVGLLGAAILCCFFWMHETAWDRETPATNPIVPTTFFANRVATFFPGTKVTIKSTSRETARTAVTPFLILISPVTLLIGFYTLVAFGFYIAMNALTPVLLQRSTHHGGYGFSVQQSAYFSFVHWIGILLALLYGHFVSDSLPLYICSVRGGTWKPEYRLSSLILPSILNPLGLGIFGAALEYHLPWPVVGLGQIFVTFSSMGLISICSNYMCECFVNHPAEASITSNALRLLFGLSIAFYSNPWVEKVGVGWTYGMMAFFEVVATVPIVVLMWKGHKIRGWTVGGLNRSEEGEKVLEKEGKGGI